MRMVPHTSMRWCAIMVGHGVWGHTARVAVLSDTGIWGDDGEADKSHVSFTCVGGSSSVAKFELMFFSPDLNRRTVSVSFYR